MVNSVTWSQHGQDGGAFNDKPLTIFDRQLTTVGPVLVYPRNQIRVLGNEVGDTSGMVTVPMCKENMGDFQAIRLKIISEICDPRGKTLYQGQKQSKQRPRVKRKCEARASFTWPVSIRIRDLPVPTR